MKLLMAKKAINTDKEIINNVSFVRIFCPGIKIIFTYSERFTLQHFTYYLFPCIYLHCARVYLSFACRHNMQSYEFTSASRASVQIFTRSFFANLEHFVRFAISHSCRSENESIRRLYVLLLQLSCRSVKYYVRLCKRKSLSACDYLGTIGLRFCFPTRCNFSFYDDCAPALCDFPLK